LTGWPSSRISSSSFVTSALDWPCLRDRQGADGFKCHAPTVVDRTYGPRIRRSEVRILLGAPINQTIQVEPPPASRLATSCLAVRGPTARSMGPGCPNGERKPHQFPICEDSRLAREDHLGRDRNIPPSPSGRLPTPFKNRKLFPVGGLERSLLRNGYSAVAWLTAYGGRRCACGTGAGIAPTHPWQYQLHCLAWPSDPGELQGRRTR